MEVYLRSPPSLPVGSVAVSSPDRLSTWPRPTRAPTSSPPPLPSPRQVVKELLATISGSQHAAPARVEALRKLAQCAVDRCASAFVFAPGPLPPPPFSFVRNSYLPASHFSFSPIARRVIKLENGVQLLTRTCAGSTDLARELAIVALRNLATSPESCAFLVSRGGLEGLLAVLKAMIGSSQGAKLAAVETLLTLTEHGDLLADVAASGVLGPLTRLLTLLSSATAESVGGMVTLILSRLATWSSSGGGPTVYSLPSRHIPGESIIPQVVEPLVQALMVGTEAGALIAERCLKALVKERDAWKVRPRSISVAWLSPPRTPRSP